MTLNKTWKQCLVMWRWVVKQWKKDNTQGIEYLKERWLQKNDPTTEIYADCYFCDYCAGECKKCPGNLVSGDFRCFYFEYDFESKPDKFLAKLEQLNKKRLSKKNSS